MTEEEVYFGAYNAAINAIISNEKTAAHTAQGNLRRGESAMNTDTLNAISAIAEQIALKATQVKMRFFR